MKHTCAFSLAFMFYDNEIFCMEVSKVPYFPREEIHSIEIKLITADAKHICSTLNHHKQLVYMLFAL